MLSRVDLSPGHDPARPTRHWSGPAGQCGAARDNARMLMRIKAFLCVQVTVPLSALDYGITSDCSGPDFEPLNAHTRAIDPSFLKIVVYY